MVLGEQGFVGLIIFLTLFMFAYGSANHLRVQGKRQPESQWLSDLGSMLQVGFVGYAVGGAFLSLSYWDLPYNMMIMAVVGRRWLVRKEWLREKPEPLITLPLIVQGWFKKKPKPAALS